MTPNIRVEGKTRPFHAVLCGYSPVLVHNSKPIWIVRYNYNTSGGIQREQVNWQVYYPTVKVPEGRHPWTVDNRRIGNGEGFKTLPQALDVAESFDFDLGIHKPAIDPFD
jgi:hypothetical protein